VGPQGQIGPAGPAGPQGAQGPAGPQLVVNALVEADGRVIAVNVPAGATFTASRTSPGVYSIQVTGLGSGCPVPVVTPFANAVSLFLSGGFCAAGSFTTTVNASNGADTAFSLLAVGTGGDPAARSARAAGSIDLPGASS
jgi:hypothetical protein